MEEIYNEYSRIVFKYLVSYTNNAELAEELTQETFYKAVKNINKFRNESSMKTWLCKIAKNAYQDLVDFKDDTDRFKTFRKSVRTDIFNGEECYVVRDGNDDLYTELWISKEDYSLKKVVKKEESKYYQEQIYTFEENGTIDEDVDTSVFDTEEYENYSRSTGVY